MQNPKIAIIGLGYVGLPLACEFSRFYDVVGFDISKSRIDELSEGMDRNALVSLTSAKELKSILFTCDLGSLRFCDVFIITVPTPLDENGKPDLAPLISASETVGSVMPENSVVIYESTVFPGATEEVCIPVLEERSGWVLNETFYCGYSPERVSPGDRTRALTDIVKITSGSNASTATFVDNLYSRIISAGTYQAGSIKIAEAAKILENTQRDVNIALMNEVSKVFHRLDIDTAAVLDAARTKWNFLNFYPGFVGGHCIGVDTEYLAYKAENVGANVSLLRTARKINESMADFVFEHLSKLLGVRRRKMSDISVMMLGVAFKENCNDCRNSMALRLCSYLERENVELYTHDPYVDQPEVSGKEGRHFSSLVLPSIKCDVVILAVAHDFYRTTGCQNIRKLMCKDGLFLDLKSCFEEGDSDFRL
jgi:UDP-N-acetyl-D-galactosamine dehydrogenase